MRVKWHFHSPAWEILPVNIPWSFPSCAASLKCCTHTLRTGGCIMWSSTCYLGLKMFFFAFVTSKICGLFSLTHSSLPHLQLKKDWRVLYCLKSSRILNKQHTCVCTHDVFTVIFAAALMPRDVRNSLCYCLCCWLLFSSCCLSHLYTSRLKQIHGHYCLLTGQVDVPEVWLPLSYLVVIKSCPHYYLFLFSSTTLPWQCLTLCPFIIWL